MERRFSRKRLLVGILISLGLMGCATIAEKKAEPTAGIHYQVKEGLEIKKVTLYLKEHLSAVPYCWLDIAVNNNTAKAVTIKIAVRVDDEPELTAMSRKPVPPQKEETFKLLTLSQTLPRRLFLAVGY